MDAIFNFGLRFAQASESKVGMTDRLLMRETVERIATGMRLISQAIGFLDLWDPGHSKPATDRLD
jgi:hypothetical protein